MMNQLETVAKKLRERGFDAAAFATKQEAASFILTDVPPARRSPSAEA